MGFPHSSTHFLLTCTAIPLVNVKPVKGTRVFHQGVRTTTNNSEVVTASEIVIVAVKPHIVETVLREVSPAVTKKHLFVSVAAGITIAEMEEVGANKHLV